MADLNGQLPDKVLAPITGGKLIIQAAAAFNAMNVESRSKGLELHPTGSASSYRTLQQQKALYAVYLAGGTLAAVPGTSNHGWGLAVDLATHEMRTMVDQIGEKYGWAKKWSDAPSEWWHIKYKVDVWKGTDPGPDGKGNPTRKVEHKMAIVLGTMPDGRFELFVEAEDKEIWHTWQAKEGGWAGAQQGKRNAAWYSLGTPGK